MKQFVQITAGRGPVECARAVALVAREILRAIPTLRLIDSEPHNQAEGCFMSMTFVSDEAIAHNVINLCSGALQAIIFGRRTNAAIGL
mgnify:CR=1 FL=1